MKETKAAAPDAAHITLLTYSTWLVIGTWLVYTGATLIYKGNSADNSYSNYFFGLIRIGFGLHAAQMARTMSRRASDPSGSLFRLLTYAIAAGMAGFPFLVFIFQAIAILCGTYQPNEIYQRNISMLITVAVFYLLATIYAGWRLKK